MKSLDKDGNEDARGFYLQAWSGKDAYTFDRIGRGLDLRVDVCCVSLLGTTQPAVISSYLSDAVVTGGGDGLVARFGMLVWPDVKADWRNVDRLPDTPAAETAMEVFQRLDQMDGTSLRFDETAQVVFDEWRVDLEKRLRSGDEHPALEGHLSKYRKLLPSLAALVELAEGQNTCVGKCAMEKALGWADCLESHARRAYSGVTGMNVASARLLLNRIQKKEIVDGFTERELYRNDWAGLGAQQVGQALKTLEEFGHVMAKAKPGGSRGGRPSRVWHIHPKYAA